MKKTECGQKQDAENENLRQAMNKRDDLKEQIDKRVETILVLQKNKNNISGREAEIRDEILNLTGATREEIPFAGELIKVRDNEKEWELSTEKILHNFALHLIVPEKYYAQVNEYVNSQNLRGRILYYRYRGFTSLKGMVQQNISSNALINKIEFKPKNLYADWLEDRVIRQYDYACVNDLNEFNCYNEKAVTKEGLIKFTEDKHQKDDRLHISRRENFVLGWDNNDKIRLIRLELKTLQEEEKNISHSIRAIEKSIKNMDVLKDNLSKFINIFIHYEDIDWQSPANEIEVKKELIAELEKTNDKVRLLERQLDVVRSQLKTLTENDLKNKEREIFRLEMDFESAKSESEQHRKIIEPIGLHGIDTSDFERLNPDLNNVSYNNLKSKQTEFQTNNADKISATTQQKEKNEKQVIGLISKFKNPPQEITEKFKDWRSDVSNLPKPEELEFIGEYQKRYKDLMVDDLPRFEKKFDEYLQETITNKVGDFRMFFENWASSIKENIQQLNESLKRIDYKDKGDKTYIQLVASRKINDEVKDFRVLLDNAIPNIKEVNASIDGRKNHFYNHIEPLITKLDKEEWRKRVMDVRTWFFYKAEEFYKETDQKFKTYENMGQLSGGEKAQLTYTILGSAIAYQFGLTKDGLQSNSFRFIAVDEAFKSQDEDKARYLITLCKQLHLQFLVVTPSDNIHIVENDISFVHFVERKEEKYSWLYDMSIEQFQEQRARFIAQ